MFSQQGGGAGGTQALLSVLPALCSGEQKEHILLGTLQGKGPPSFWGT